MGFEFSGDKGIYIQLAEWIEENILKDVFPVQSQIPSAAELAVTFKINHITALKGMNILADAGILEKRRGMGMYVTVEAKNIILKEHKEKFGVEYIAPLLKEAQKLDISGSELLEMIKKELEDKS